MTAITDIHAPSGSPTPARVKLDEPMDIRAVLIYLAVIAGALVLHGLLDLFRHRVRRRRPDHDNALPAARRRDADRARLRIRQRLPRHRQRGGHGHLHPRAEAADRRGLVGLLQSARRAAVERRGRIRHRFVAAGRTHPAGRLQRRLRHGVRAVDRRDHLEPRHLVARPARLQLAHDGRLDRRRRRRQRVHARPGRHCRGSIGAKSRKSAKPCCFRRCSASSSRPCCCW